MTGRIALIGLIFFTGNLNSSDFHVRFTRSKCGIPENEYDVNSTKGFVQVAAIFVGFEADTVKQKIWTPSGEAIFDVLRKRFNSTNMGISTQFVKVQGMQVALYETGETVTSGMVWSAGGSIGELKGNRIRITIKYMGGYRQAKEPSATDINRSVAILPGPVYHEAVIERFVRKNEPSSLLFNVPCNHLLRQHFQEIERVEIQLQVMKDR